MNKITRIQLTGPEIVFWRGTEKIKRFHSENITPASRLRLNDVLAVWTKEHKIEARPYVGTGWLVTNLYVVDVPAKNKATVAKIEQRVTEVGIERLRHHGSAFNEVDFVCGAGAALDALGLFGHIPSLWVFGPLAGMKIFELEKES